MVMYACTMTTVATAEAQAHLPELLQRSSRGERFIVVDHGKPLACLGPLPKQASRQTIKGIAARAKTFRSRLQLDSRTIKEDIANGRL